MSHRHSPIGRAAKRAIDVVGSIAGLVLLAPVLVASAVAVRLTMGAPVLFRHRRPGLGGRPFTLLKFRTMREVRTGEDMYRTDAERITRLGRALRGSSIDELPELLNVLRGEMSLVGPRPLLMEYLDRYTPEERRRHEVRPGITGWAQVNGRQTIPFSKRIELDVWYVDNRSIWLDLRILAMTVLQVIRPRGVISGQSLDDVDDLGLSADKARKGSESEKANEPPN